MKYLISYSLVDNDMAGKTSDVYHRGNALTNMSPAAFVLYMSELQCCICHVNNAETVDSTIAEHLLACPGIERINDYGPADLR